MTNMVENAIQIVGNNTFDAVFDKGYYTAEEIHKTQQLGIKTHVCVPNPASHAPDKTYDVSQFIYDPKQDTYTCPAGQTLQTNGNWYQKISYQVKQYKTKNCNNCPVKAQCTKAKYQKIIERHEFADALEINKQNIEANPHIYAQRQSLVEHPFGTMKRQWGFDHIMTKKSINRASSDVGFIFIAYNLTRLMKIIGVTKLKEITNSIFAIFSSKIIKNSGIKHLMLHLNYFLLRFCFSILLFSNHKKTVIFR